MLAVLFLFDEGVLNQEKFQLQTFEDWFRVVLDPKLKDQKISLGYCIKVGLTILYRGVRAELYHSCHCYHE